jgi:uncharacterized protein YukE
MPDQAINIRITLTDQVTKNLKKTSEGMRDFSRQMKETGRNLSQVGSYMAILGAGITAPLIKAYTVAGQFSAEISHQLNQTKNVFDNLSLSIGKSLLPVMRQLTDAVANAVNWWNGLEQATRDKLIQNIMKLGIAFVALGTALIVVGNALKLLANLAVLSSTLLAMNPVVLVVTASIAGLAIAMWKCKTFGDMLIDTLQAIARLSPLANIARIFQGKTPDEFFGKQGDWKNKFNELKTMFDEIGKSWTDLSSAMANGAGASENPAGGFWMGFEKAVSDARDNLLNLQQTGIDVANKLTTSLSTAFSSFIEDAFSGQLKRAQDYFAAFGNSILSIFSQMISKMVAEWIAFQLMLAGKKVFFSVINALGATGGAASGQGASQGTYGSENFVDIQSNTVASPYLHSGGFIRAHSGYTAKDEVPIIAQSGEGILSRRGMNALGATNFNKLNRGEGGGGGGLNINIMPVIQAWDVTDIYRNKSAITSIISEAIRNNSDLRKVIKQYA